jgi:hypothetical protein
VIATCDAPEEPLRQRLRAQGFDACLPWPYAMGDLLGVLEQLSAEDVNNKGRSWRA